MGRGPALVLLLSLGFFGSTQFKVYADEPASAASRSDYAGRLAAYEAARAAFDLQAETYWQSVADMRRSRNAKRRNHEEIVLFDYVLTQPPIYSGPPLPLNPDKPPDQPAPGKLPIPVVADFVRNAEEQFTFVPERPTSEWEFKRAYVKRAKEAGLTRDQVVRVYGFESGGDGKYDVQAGLEYPRPEARAVSTALGYNQLLSTNSVELLAEKGDAFLTTLQRMADRPGKAARLAEKSAMLRRMIEFARSGPDDWSVHERLAAEPNGLGIHALNLDVDVGPLLQAQKLLDSVVFARAKGFGRALTAAELEMMNLTGDGNGFDMISLPEEMRGQVPTSNFFQRGGYERNPIAARNDTVAKLVAATDAKMHKEAVLSGAKEMAKAYDGL